jgi:hypothetical protein
MVRLRTAIAASCALAFSAPAAVRAAEPGGPTAPGADSVTRVLVRFAADASAALRAQMRAEADVPARRHVDGDAPRHRRGRAAAGARRRADRRGPARGAAEQPGVSLRIDRRTLRTVRARGLRLALGASEACRTSIEVRVDARSTRRLDLPSRIIGRASVRLTRAGRRAVTVLVLSRAARALRSATRVRVVARAVAVDASGNRRGTERTATLKR